MNSRSLAALPSAADRPGRLLALTIPVPLAHHANAVLEALPFFGPALVILIVVVFLMIREQISYRRASK